MLTYKCEIVGNDQNVIESGEETLTYDFSGATAASCVFEVPRERDVVIDVANGSIDLIKLSNNTSLKAVNAKVSITPDSAIDYLYELSVKMGHVDDFTSSENKESAFRIHVDVTNGLVEKI